MSIDGDVDSAIFVSPDGDDLGTGEMDDPVKTINAGISLAQGLGADVYVCNGTYTREIRIVGQGVNIYGGYDCNDDWKRVPDRAIVEAPLGVPLTLEGVDGVTIERLVFRAASTTELGASSIAASISQSTNVRLRRVELESGDAGPGENGSLGTPISIRAPQGANGTVGCRELSCGPGGSGGSSTPSTTCASGEPAERGGAGGDGPNSQSASSRENGFDSPVHGTAGGRGASADGAAGDDGDEGTRGSLSSRPIGSFQGPSYLPTNGGESGGFGTNGHAGGGGAGSARLTVGDLCCASGVGGGQGGRAGCGGWPGGESQGGGASIALVIDQSEVELVWVRLLTGDGGDGGSAGAGTTGQQCGKGGKSGETNNVEIAGTGGRGGDGGKGGDGAPGGGGPALGIALVDSPVPAIEEVQILLGDPGFGGGAVSGSDAADGVVADAYDFTEELELQL